MIDLIVANYNRAGLVGATIKSIMAQTCQDWKLIVVDDGSTDNSVEMIETAFAGDSRCSLFRTTHSGIPGNVKNYGANWGDSKYLAFVDSDDTLEPTAVEEVLAQFDKLSAKLVYTNQAEIDEFGMEHIGHNAKIPYSTEKMLEINCIRQFAVMERQLFEHLHGHSYQYKYASDYDLYMRACELTSVVHLEKTLYRRLKHKNHNQISTINNKEQQYYAALVIRDAHIRRNLSIPTHIVDKISQH